MFSSRPNAMRCQGFWQAFEPMIRPPTWSAARAIRGRMAMAGRRWWTIIVRKLFALIARCHQMLEDIPSALNACAAGLRLDPDDAEIHFRKAVLHRKAGQPAEAEACWRRILTLKRPDQFCNVDQGIYGHLTLRNLAALAEERGDRGESRRLWRMVLDACPGDPEAMARGEFPR